MNLMNAAGFESRLRRKASPVTSFFMNLLGFDFRFSSSRMNAQIPHLSYLLKHHALPLLKRTLIDLLAGVLDFVR